MVYVFSGASAAEGVIAPIAMGFGLYNDNVNTVAGGGDINGDGFDDVLFGSPAADGSAANTGQIHVMYGRPAEPDGRIVRYAHLVQPGVHTSHEFDRYSLRNHLLPDFQRVHHQTHHR